MSPTVLIIEENAVLRQSLCCWLKTMFPECHTIEAADGEEANALSRVILSHVVLIDIDTLNGNSLNTVTDIQRTLPGAGVVVLSSYSPETIQMNALTGVSAWVSKWRIFTQLKPVLTELLYHQKAEIVV